MTWYDITKSRNDFVAGFLCLVWHKFAEMSHCRGIEVIRVQIMGSICLSSYNFVRCSFCAALHCGMAQCNLV